jgi:alkylation response protein AidB-like acyl-CoA dehydrogenase
MTTIGSTPDELAARVEPVLRQYAPVSEAERRLAPEAMAALVDAGLLRVWTPRVYGGLEMDPVTSLQLFEAISRIDSAAGWIAGNSSGYATLGALLPQEGTDEMFADPRAVCAGALFPPGTAEPVQGGYRVSGRWPFGSACSYATWLIGQALVMENGTPRMGPDGRPVAIVVVMRAGDAQVFDDTWHTLGMRGTGSYDFGVTDVFVPEQRTWTIGPGAPSNPLYTGPLYRMGLWLVSPQVASVPLGIAQAAIDDLIALAGAKTPSYTQTSLADKPVVQERVARARAYVEAGRRSLYGAVAEAWDYVLSGRQLDTEHGIPVALAASFAVEAACNAVDLVHSCAGTSAIREAHRFQQYFRDVHTLSQHAFATPNGRFESLGKLMLGRETDWVFYYL